MQIQFTYVRHCPRKQACYTELDKLSFLIKFKQLLKHRVLSVVRETSHRDIYYRTWKMQAFFLFVSKVRFTANTRRMHLRNGGWTGSV